MYSDTKKCSYDFFPHPMSVITDKLLPILMDISDKERALRTLDIDLFIVVEFSKVFSKLEKLDFIQWLKALHVKRIVVGRDFKFGHNGSGSIDDLKAHFEVHIVDDLLYKNTRVSTTYIKLLLEQGDIELTKKLLNKSYSIHGEVIHGDKVGKLIGYPTANIDYKNHYLPKIGVYAVKVQIDDKTYLGCANLGHNPTINYSTTRRLEVFIMDYDGDLYEKEITVSFEYYLRDEIKYDQVKDMLLQIEKDVQKNIQFIKIINL